MSRSRDADDSPIQPAIVDRRDYGARRRLADVGYPWVAARRSGGNDQRASWGDTHLAARQPTPGTLDRARLGVVSATVWLARAIVVAVGVLIWTGGLVRGLETLPGNGAAVFVGVLALFVVVWMRRRRASVVARARLPRAPDNPQPNRLRAEVQRNVLVGAAPLSSAASESSRSASTASALAVRSQGGPLWQAYADEQRRRDATVGGRIGRGISGLLLIAGLALVGSVLVYMLFWAGQP